MAPKTESSLFVRSLANALSAVTPSILLIELAVEALEDFSAFFFKASVELDELWTLEECTEEASSLDEDACLLLDDFTADDCLLVDEAELTDELLWTELKTDESVWDCDSRLELIELDFWLALASITELATDCGCMWIEENDRALIFDALEEDTSSTSSLRLLDEMFAARTVLTPAPIPNDKKVIEDATQNLPFLYNFTRL